MDTTYTIIVRTDDSERAVIRDCGHKHRTIRGAARCYDNLLHGGFQPGTWSATWHTARIEDQNGNHVPTVTYPDGTVEIVDYKPIAKKG
jgi:hypothetical protein